MTIKKQVLKAVQAHADTIKITDANRVRPGETFEAYLKRMASQRNQAGFCCLETCMATLMAVGVMFIAYASLFAIGAVV